MLFRQLFDADSCTYTYLLAGGPGGEAILIDPVLERVDVYLRLVSELDLRLAKAIDTHIHADHRTALGALRDRTRCITIMGERSSVDVVSMRVREGDAIEVEGVRLDVLYTPGHTDCSYSFAMGDRVFTGDTLLIRGTGRTDFQNGDAYAAYDSIFGKLLALKDETLVFPGHDYKGETSSTIGEERAHNPRLQVKNAREYAERMRALRLSDPKLMDVAVPYNRRIGTNQRTGCGVAVTAREALRLVGSAGVVFVDLREEAERARAGEIPGSLHAPYRDLASLLAPGGLLRHAAGADVRHVAGADAGAAGAGAGARLLFYCSFGERSALAAASAVERGIASVGHLVGGVEAWLHEEGPLAPAAAGS